MIVQKTIELPAMGRGFHLITKYISGNLSELPETGLLNIFLKHTSAAITINENADPTVRDDFESFMSRLVPEGERYFIHTLEGPDDMPAHIKSSLFGQSITIPITNHKLNMGTWQGIFLCEFREYSERRKVVLTLYS